MVYTSTRRAVAGSDVSLGVAPPRAGERSGVAAMALGIIERCLELCVDYALSRF